MKFQDQFAILTDTEREHVEKILERYKSQISIEQIAEGIRVTLLNARQLYDDATLLLQSSRYARSLAMLVAAMEEIGKISVLAGMSRIPKNNQKLWADSWESFRSHEHKSTWAFVQTYPDEARSAPMAVVTAAMQQLSLAVVCERMRQYGLYVDFHAGERRWLSQTEIDQTEVIKWKERVEAALSRTEAFYAAGLYSVRALELQRQVYSEFNANRPRRKDLGPEDLKSAVSEGPMLAKTYIRRLVEEGVVSPDLDLSVQGTPLSHLLADGQAPGSDDA
ncbi:MAG: AbiV family abortive infection protein [Planctomycetota bacterium]|nr:AbiV family abortive infection protein [Planctomycetota bacterium]